MRLSELISFVRRIEATPDLVQQPPPGPSHVEEPNAPRRERPEVPPWIPRGRRGRDHGEPVVVRDGGSLVLDLEGEVSPAALPEDIRQPNPVVDVLAYYLPFHLYHSDWGIYLRESGVLVVASILKGSPPGRGDTEVLELARDILTKHELLHFRAEVACARAEVVTRVRLYDLYFKDGFAAAHEEALANALAFRVVRREPALIQARVSTWMKHQGAGYRDFDKWVAPGKYRLGCRRAAQYMLDTVARLAPSRGGPSEFLFDSIARFRPPVYWVLDVKLTSVLKPFPKAHGMRVLVPTRDHHPPHIHIELPPGRPYTRYLWPELKPLKRDPELSSKERKALEAYLADYGAEIAAKISAVYGYAPAEVSIRQGS